MFCPTCKQGMVPMIVSWFCKNNCDRVGPQFVAGDRWTYSIHTPHGVGYVVLHSSYVPTYTYRFAKWWLVGRSELDTAYTSSVWVDFSNNRKIRDPSCEIWKSIDSGTPFKITDEVLLKGAVYVV